MHLQENSLFDLDPKVKVTGNVAQYPLHHVTQSLKLLRLTVYGEIHLQEKKKKKIGSAVAQW